MNQVYLAFTADGKDIREVFRSLDKNKDGSVSFDEMKAGLRNMNVNISQEECKQIFEILDLNKSGIVTLNELKDRLESLKSEEIASLKSQGSFMMPKSYSRNHQSEAGGLKVYFSRKSNCPNRTFSVFINYIKKAGPIAPT